MYNRYKINEICDSIFLFLCVCVNVCRYAFREEVEEDKAGCDVVG